MLAPDSTLRDIQGTLPNPENFVRQVVGVMLQSAKELGAPVIMRIGITGTGQAPNYRIDAADDYRAITAIDGANHKPWPEGERFEAAANWSSSTMSLLQVQTLLGEIRSRGGKKRLRP